MRDNLTKKPELNTSSLKIDKLVNRVNEGEIKIPAFQRGYVWRQNQIIDLMQSIANDFPIGSILLWEANEKEKLRSTRNIAGYLLPERGENWPVNYVLDGQQRLSSIYGVFSGDTQQDITTTKYNPSLDIFEIYYDFKTKRFLSKSEVSDNQTCILLRNVIDPLKLVDQLMAMDSKYHQDAKALSSKFLNYEVPVVQIKNRTKEEVGVIFERINNTGTKLNTLDLMTAWTWTNDFHLIDSIDELVEDLEEKGFGSIDNRLILQVISGMLIGSTKTENILRLTGDKVRERWDDVKESMKKVVDFLATEIQCKNIDFLPYHQQLIPLGRMFYKEKKPSAELLEAARRFFWITSFSDRYSSGQTTAKMDADIASIDTMIDGDYSVLKRYTVSCTAKEMIGTKFSKANPLTRSVLLLLTTLSPIDLANGTKVDVGKALSSYNRKEYHHIFPNAFLKRAGYSTNEIFSVANFCFLSSASNKKISNKKPSEYFKKVVRQDKIHEILESNAIPFDLSIIDKDDYPNFLQKRASLILDKLSTLTD
ncbi:GmrSD restriction endonuclease domain-containing protein [Serratia marcescens]|uniref:GmrSD restriction endonuclease domain-containing protein n=1 Tax=Serratia marcescens TaxID=615 RepID=UPI0032049429